MSDLKSHSPLDTLVMSTDYASQAFVCSFFNTFPVSKLVLAHVEQSGVVALMPRHVTVEKVALKDAVVETRRVIASFGIFPGVNSGACLYAASKHCVDGSNTVALLDDSAWMYQDTLFNDDWLLDHDILDMRTVEAGMKFRGASVEDLQLPVRLLPSFNAHHYRH